MGVIKDKILGTLAAAGVGGSICFTAAAILGGIVYLTGAITLGQVFEGAVSAGAVSAAITIGSCSKSNSGNEK